MKRLLTLIFLTMAAQASMAATFSCLPKDTNGGFYVDPYNYGQEYFSFSGMPLEDWIEIGGVYHLEIDEENLKEIRTAVVKDLKKCKSMGGSKCYKTWRFLRGKGRFGHYEWVKDPFEGDGIEMMIVEVSETTVGEMTVEIFQHLNPRYIDHSSHQYSNLICRQQKD